MMNKILRIGSIIIILTTLFLAARSQYLLMNTPQEPQKIEVTQVADVVPDLSIPEFVLNDTSIVLFDGMDCAMLNAEVECVIFSYDDGELMRFNLKTGSIYWKDRLVTTDKELVEGIRNIIQENRCPECKKRMGY